MRKKGSLHGAWISIVFSDVSTVHPDYRAHKPVLRASTSRTIAHECRPLLFFFLNVIATLVSFASSPCTLQAIKLIALNTTVDIITVASALGVYLFEVSVLFFCISEFCILSHHHQLIVLKFIAYTPSSFLFTNL
jgi:hypothetical protein